MMMWLSSGRPAPKTNAFLGAGPAWYRDPDDVWLRVGWRPSEILAVRFDWLDFHRQTVALKRGRIARRRHRSATEDGRP